MNNSADDNREIFDAYKKSRSIEDRNKIVEKYLYIVNILVRKYLNRGVDYDDLYQVGSMALVLAAERYDPERGVDFPALRLQFWEKSSGISEIKAGRLKFRGR